MPKIEKVTFDVSLAHFLLMFGYKLFSLYYPLFLISIGFQNTFLFAGVIVFFCGVWIGIMNKEL